VGDRELSVLLVKNPAGANEILRTLTLEPGELNLLGVLNDRTADGRDVSWVWDADFELLAGRVRRVTCAGTRAAELALRLKYAGIPSVRLDVVPHLPTALDRALAESPPGAGVYALPTYTALLELRAELARRGHVGQFYEREPA
jgi:UDP-N-acetylmuramyl tripeptide synthase